MSRYPGGGHGTQERSAPMKMEFCSNQQRDIFQYGPAPLCASGGQGGGKTLGLTRKILLLSDMFPGNRGAIIRKVWDELKKTTMVSFFKDCPPEAYSRGGRRADQDKILRLNPRRCEDGVTRSSEILWLYLDDPNIETILRGLEINWFLIDQAEEVEEENYKFLLGRLGRWDKAFVPPDIILREKAAGRKWAWWNQRTGLPLPPTYPMLTCSPDTEMHWIWRHFHEDSPEWRDHWRALGYKMVHFDSRDNKFLTQQNLEHMLSQGDAYIRRFVKGEWGMPEGRIHTIPNDSIIEGSPEVFEWIMSNCRSYYRILDHGDTSPTCCMWMAVTEGGDCIFYREYYKPDALVSDHRYAIREHSQKDGLWKDRYTDLCDPSMLLKTMQRLGGRYTIGDEYCLAPETRVLTADLRHVPVGTLEVGDELAAFDEMPNGSSGRYWRRSIVEATGRKRLPSYRLTFSDGTVVAASRGHKWLIESDMRNRRWVTTEALRLGQRGLRVVDVWDTDHSFGAGYLAAAYDGEGWLLAGHKRGNRIGFSQRENAMLTRVLSELDSRGFTYALGPVTMADKFNHTGGACYQALISYRSDVMRLLGMIRPERLLLRFDVGALGRVHARDRPELVKKEFIGLQEVVALRTSTHTVVAEGLMSHNTDCSVMPRDTAIFWQPADNNELGTRNRINEYLRLHPTHRHPLRREQVGAPYVYFVRASATYPDGCNYIIRETRSQRRKKIGNEQGQPVFGEDRDDAIPDHAYDCLRYALAGRGPVSGPTVEKRSDRWTAADTNLWLDQRKAKAHWTPVPLAPVRRIM